MAKFLVFIFVVVVISGLVTMAAGGDWLSVLLKAVGVWVVAVWADHLEL